jgi:phosphatidate cytidylyltransferase
MNHSTEDGRCDGEAASSLAKIVQLPIYFLNHPLSRTAILGLVLSLSGIVGDLAESSVKRLSRKKDSGGLLPGHGGVVDRFDSTFVAGVAYYYWVLA